MKKNLFTAFLGLILLPAGAQSYVKSVVTHESSANACDATLSVIPYNMKPPYATRLYNYASSRMSQGFTYEGLCSGPMMYFNLLDSACRNSELYVVITEDPADMILLDTVLAVQPTSGNSDGSLNFIFDQLPSGCQVMFGPDNYVDHVSTTSFTGLPEGGYWFSVQNSSSGAQLSFNVYLGATPSPCHYTPYDIVQVPASAPGETGEFCDGEVLMLVNGEVADGYGTFFNELYTGGGSGTLFNDSSAHPVNVCRGMYEVAVFPHEDFYHFPIQYVFVEDSTDVHTTWGEPGLLPLTDTVWLSTAFSLRDLDFSLPLDSAYISGWKYLGANQFELEISYVQDSTVFRFYELAEMDSTSNYIFDFTVVDIDLLNLTHEDHFRTFIYFGALNTKSMFFAQAPAGDPERISAFPNPFDENFTLVSPHMMTEAALYSAGGSLLETVRVNSTRYNWSMGRYRPGLYLVRVTDVNGRTKVIKLTKNR